MSNLAEYRAGTDPTNPLSRLAFSSVTPGAAGPVLTWQSVTGRSYTVATTTVLAAGFTGFLATNAAASPPANTFTDTITKSGPVYYRIDLETNR